MNLNTGPYIERCPHDRENPYSQTSRSLIRDNSIHPAVSWMLIYLLSMKDGWKITPKQIINHVKGHFGCGRDKVYDWIKEACDAGYMKKDEWLDGNLKRCRYLLSEYPKFKKSFPHPDDQDPDGSDPANTYYKKEQYKKKHKEEEKEEEQCSSKKDSATPQTTTRVASRTATSSKISFDKEKRQFIGITPEDIDSWKAKFTALSLGDELDQCVEWAVSNPRKNYRRSILSWLRNIQESRRTPFKAATVVLRDVSEEDVLRNNKMALKWERASSETNQGSPFTIQCTSAKVIFAMPNNEGYAVSYDFPTEEFEKKCQRALKRMKISNGKN